MHTQFSGETFEEAIEYVSYFLYSYQAIAFRNQETILNTLYLERFYSLSPISLLRQILSGERL